ncbi:uncharacterized protein BYT42DRAFT_618462 [Radiomyces spectabilis]|uniref:uncharacterized protein n=1 Tax=Radiomyces spectabilis TaxID=64574 RepID=UPI00221E44AD|nr:uncharacterized protein BYT42DRAFT_618462 [Radiomyces spectabilis]KAI8366021.1 hypothetical protein BYT42DRAFT_618462 [Radiomyces spectabilis]
MSHTAAVSLLNEILKEIAAQKKVTNDQLLTLHGLVGNVLIEALHLVDNQAVAKVICPTQRMLYEVGDVLSSKSTTTATYMCLIQPHYCSCHDFFQFVVCKQAILTCRHLLATVLAQALDAVKETQLNDEAFAEKMYLSMGFDNK